MIESKGYKITPIDGDLAVSRNAEIGRDVDIHGKARVAGSLKVEGFLDAPNIKGAVRGLFATEEELKREYPNPRPGWCAIVLADDESGFLYLAKNREWEKQSEEAKPFDFIIDSINVFASKDELQAEKTEREEVEEDIKEELDKTLRYANTEFNHLEDVVELICFDSANKKHLATSIYAAEKTAAGVMTAEDKRVLDKVADDIEKKQTVVQVEWVNEGNVSNMNDFTEAGVYEIKGEHTRIDDNLPFDNTGGGHTFHARLEVLDSSISDSSKDTDKCITQKLTLSNRVAGDGGVYIRTGRGRTYDTISWETWGKLQQNIEVGEVTNVANLIDNGIYSGVYKDGNTVFTFVMVVINDYAIGVSPRRVSQFVYGLSKVNGSVFYRTRVGEGNDSIVWGDWKDINEDNIASMINTAIKDITEGIDPDKLDSLKDIISWIDEHGKDAAAMLQEIQQNTVKINAEVNRAQAKEKELSDAINDSNEAIRANYEDIVNNAEKAIRDDNEIKAKSLHVNTLNFETRAESVMLSGKAVDGNATLAKSIPAATIETAGVMSAADKKALDEAVSDIVGINDAMTLDREESVERDNSIKANAMQYNTLGVSTYADKAEIYGRSINTDVKVVEFPAATTEKAGVMTAEDKREQAKKSALENGDIIVGQAREIHSRNGKNDSASFLVRTTAGSGTIGDGVATLKSVGGNIVKNLVDGTFESGWRNIQVLNSGVANREIKSYYDGFYGAEFTTVSGHQYLFTIFVLARPESRFLMKVVGVNNDNSVKDIKAIYFPKTDMQWVLLSYIHTATSDYPELKMDVLAESNNTNLSATKPLVINLTEMFGAGKEPSKEECDKLFGTMDALPQGLSIANPSVFKSTGWNQFNPDMVLEGKAVVDNAIVDGDKMIAIIPCLPCKIGEGENNGYHIHGEFDDIKVYLTPLNPMEVEGELYMHELALSEKGSYVPQIKGYMIVEVPTTANLCAHFLWSEDCDKNAYEPYYESVVELPRIPEMSEYGLAGIQSSGTLVRDEIDFVKGVYRKKIYCIEDLGSLSWGRTAGSARYVPVGENNTLPKLLNNLIAVGYTQSTADNVHGGKIDKSIYIGKSGYFNSNVCCIAIYDSQATDKESMTSLLSGVKLYAELDVPVEYPLPKVNNNYTSSDYGVEQFDSNIPCNANNLYYMRSLAGETRNFLDRMYANTAKESSKDVADYITNNLADKKKLETLQLNNMECASRVSIKYDSATKTLTIGTGYMYFYNGKGKQIFFNNTSSYTYTFTGSRVIVFDTVNSVITDKSPEGTLATDIWLLWYDGGGGGLAGGVLYNYVNNADLTKKIRYNNMEVVSRAAVSYNSSTKTISIGSGKIFCYNSNTRVEINLTTPYEYTFTGSATIVYNTADETIIKRDPTAVRDYDIVLLWYDGTKGLHAGLLYRYVKEEADNAKEQNAPLNKKISAGAVILDNLVVGVPVYIQVRLTGTKCGIGVYNAEGNRKKLLKSIDSGGKSGDVVSVLYVVEEGDAKIKEAGWSSLYLDYVLYLDASSYTTREGVVNQEKYINTQIAASLDTPIKSIMHGGTGSYPQNNLVLYKNAAQKGMLFWECDVRPCADGYVLSHDDDMYQLALDADGNQLTQGDWLCSQKTVAELKTLRTGIKKGVYSIVKGYENATVATLEEFIVLAKVYGACPVIEIKFTATEAQIREIYSIVKRHGMVGRSLFLLYGNRALHGQYFHAIDENANLVFCGEGSIAESDLDAIISYKNDRNVMGLSYFIGAYTDEVLNKALDAGLLIGTWSSTSSSNIVSLVNKGYSMFTIDDMTQNSVATLRSLI